MGTPDKKFNRSAMLPFILNKELLKMYLNKWEKINANAQNSIDFNKCVTLVGSFHFCHCTAKVQEVQFFFLFLNMDAVLIIHLHANSATFDILIEME